MMITLVFLLGANMLFAACTFGAKTYNDGDTYCDATGAQICSGDTWAAHTCTEGCDLTNNICFECQGGTYACNPDDPNEEMYCEATDPSGAGYYSIKKRCANGCDFSTGRCKTTASPMDDCPVEGMSYCFSASEMNYCTDADGDGFREWVTVACAPGVCDYSIGACSSSAGESCSPGSSFQCQGDHNIEYCNPVTKTWEYYDSCAPQYCVEIPPFDVDCVGCHEGDPIVCNAAHDSLVKCVNGSLVSTPCPASAPVCIDNAGGDAYCGGSPPKNDTNNTNDDNGDGGKGSTDYHGRYIGGGSGGGSVDVCYSWTEWKVDTVDNFQKLDDMGEVLVCKSVTSVRYCDEGDEVDYSEYETKVDEECEYIQEEAETCDYIYARTETYTEDTGDGMCRECSKDILVYECNTGRVESTNIKEQSAGCSDWSACKTEVKDEEKTEPPFSALTLSEQVDLLLRDYGLLLGLLLLVFIAILGYGVYSKMSEDEQDPDDEFKPEDYPPKDDELI